MLHKDHGWLIPKDQLLHLKPREDIHIIQRLVPEIKMGRPAETGGYQNLFLLARAELIHILFKLYPGEVQFTQDGLEKAFVQPFSLGEGAQAAVKEGCILGNIAAGKPGPEPAASGGCDGGSAGEIPNDGGFAGAVPPSQTEPFARLQLQPEVGQDSPITLEQGEVRRFDQPPPGIGWAGQLQRFGFLQIF